MKMKKSLIALAVAGAFAAPAFAASSNVDIYGKFRVSLDHANHDAGWSLTDNVSRIGIKGAEDLGGGLKAIYQWETAFNLGTSSGRTSSGVLANSAASALVAPSAGGLGGQRDTFVGLSGNFGTALVGRHDTPYKMAGSADLYADTRLDAQNMGANCIICEDVRVNNAVAYVSPSFSGLTLAGAIVPGGAGADVAGVKSAHGLADAYSLAALYGNGPLSVTAGYENLHKLVGPTTGSNDQKAFKLNGAYTFGDFKVGATYEKIKDVLGSNNDQKSWLVSGAYGMGPISLTAQYGVRNPDGSNNNLKDFTIGAGYSLSKRTNTYVAYGHYKQDAVGGDTTTNLITMGLNHDF
jgi:predicted porin